jgi:hypothetical protein
MRSAIECVDQSGRTAAGLLREQWNRSADRAQAAASPSRSRADRCSCETDHSRLPTRSWPSQHPVGLFREPERAARRAETGRRARACRLEGRSVPASCRPEHARRLASLLSALGGANRASGLSESASTSLISTCVSALSGVTANHRHGVSLKDNIGDEPGDETRH